MSLSLNQQARTLASYFPSGRAFGSVARQGTVSSDLLLGLAQELLRSEDLVQEFRDEILPDETILFLSEWESAVEIPDDCFLGGGTDDERRRDVLAKLVSLGVQTNADFVTLANLYGLNVTITGGSVHGAFPFEFPIILFPSGRHARHTMVVDVDLPVGLTFPYTFPISFGDADTILLECLFNKLKPANVDVLFINL